MHRDVGRAGALASAGAADEPAEDQLAAWASAQLETLRRAVREEADGSLHGLVATVELAHNEWRRRVDEMRCSRRHLDLDVVAADEAWQQMRAVLALATSKVVGGVLEHRDLPHVSGEHASPDMASNETSPQETCLLENGVGNAMLPRSDQEPPHGIGVAGTTSTAAVACSDRSVPDHTLAAFMFGRFRVFTHGASINTWHGVKPQTVLRYLLARPGHQVPRDVLVDLLWPDADAEVGRRNLHQVIYSLRRALREASTDTTGVIVHENDSYRLDERVDLWIDVATFEQHVSEARRRAQAGNDDGAIAEYLNAERLYADDYLTDALYEEWTVGERERLRMSCAELVEGLGALLFERRRFTDIIAVCQRRLRTDPAAEVAHRWMMRVYAELGQRDLALQQYRYCSEVLQREWGLRPTPDTERIYLDLST